MAPKVHGRSSTHKHGSKSKHVSSESQKPEPTPVSFLFVVNELPTNDNPDIEGSVPERRDDHGRWQPPSVSRGFFAQIPGNVYKWENGVVSLAEEYVWETFRIDRPPQVANGAIRNTLNEGWPVFYRASTVFFSNHWENFHAAVGDAGTREIEFCGNEQGWHTLKFHHHGGISQVDYAGEEEFLAVQTASWIDQLLPTAYQRKRSHGITEGGLAGLLPLIVALVAFSCADRRELRRVLLVERAWRRRRWDPHSMQHGRIPGRGVIATVFLDPDNPDGSTPTIMRELEYGNIPMFR